MGSSLRNWRLSAALAVVAVAIVSAFLQSPWPDTGPMPNPQDAGLDLPLVDTGTAAPPARSDAPDHTVWNCIVTEQNGLLLARPTVRSSGANAQGELVACPPSGVGENGEIAEHGRFTLAVARNVVRVMVEITAENAVRTTFRLEVPAVDAAVPIPLVVNGLSDLEIRVTDRATNAAIGKARVHLHRRRDEPPTITVGQDASLHATADSDGLVSMRPCAGQYQLRCQAPGFLPEDRTVSLVGPRQSLALALQPGGALAAGIVIEDDSERPVEGAKVELAGAEWSKTTGQPDLAVISDADGRFAIPFDPRIAQMAFAQLIVDPPAGRTDLIRLRTDAVWGDPLVLRLPSSRPRIRLIRARDGSQASADWEVATAMIGQTDPNQKTVWTPVTRDVDGLFVPPPDARWHSDAWFRVATWEPSRGRAFAMLYTLPSKLTSKGRVYEWIVPEPAEFEILVRSASTGEPLAEATVELLWSGQDIENARGAKAIPDYDPVQHMPYFSHVAQELGRGITGADGRVRMAGLQTQPVWVRCSLAGHRPEIAEVGKDRTAVVELTFCGHAEGILIGATGEVFVSSAPLDPRAEVRFVPGQSVEMKGDGRFVLVGHAVGRYRLFLYDRQRRGRFFGEIDVVPGAAAPVRFQAPDLQPIRFGLRSEDLRVGDTVQVTSDAGGLVFGKVEEPECVWLELCSGEYRAVRVRGEGPNGELAFASGRIEVTATGPRETTVSFLARPGTVRLLENGQPVGRQWVRIAGLAGTAVWASLGVTDTEGWLRLSGVPVGEFTLLEQHKVLTRFTDGPRRWRVSPTDLGASVDATR